MTCIMTVLTVLSTLNGAVWNDVEVQTKVKVVPETNPYTFSKIEMLSDEMKLYKSVSVQCGDDVDAVTTSFLKTVK